MSRKMGIYLCLVALAFSSAPRFGQEAKPKQNDVLAGYRGALTRSMIGRAPNQRAGGKGGRRDALDSLRRPRSATGLATIIYDDGVASALPLVSSMSYGNQFNTRSGDPVSSFSVSMLTFFLLTGAGTDNVFVSVFGSVNGTTAPVLGSMNVGPNVSGAFNAVDIGPYAGAGSFLAGIWYVAGDTVGLGPGTVNGQGHHGMVINDIVGTGFQTLPGLNALVRATTGFIPVELMYFEVTDE